MRTSVLELPPNTRVQTDEEFFTITYIQSKSLPGARIGIHSSARRETHLISPMDWGNIWIYGMDILLTGWLTRAELNRLASPLPEGARVFQYDKIRTKNLYVPVHNLRLISNLLEHVMEWSK